MPEFTVFWVDELAGRAEAITAISAELNITPVLAGDQDSIVPQVQWFFQRLLRSLQKNDLNGRVFPTRELIAFRSALVPSISVAQNAGSQPFCPVGAPWRAQPGHTSGQPPVHAAAIAGLSRLPSRIRL
ncbi:MAG: hypothetical protein VKO00_05915, partial [Cyanobacteriota bacterium]|nr:hypothetical protein [Cyanobacteriota bacterium]